MNRSRYRSRIDSRERYAGSVFSSMLSVLLISSTVVSNVNAKPYQPTHDEQVLAVIPASARHAQLNSREFARNRLDVALPLAQLYITQSRHTGDLRFLGYAESVLQPWLSGVAISADALVLQATVLQSRHEFSTALTVIDQALQLRGGDAQAWLTRATILRVLGRYDEALTACQELGRRAASEVTELCTQSLRGLMGELPAAYQRVGQLSAANLSAAARAWRDSELGEMAMRLGRDAEAEQWFQSGLRFAPDDFYIKAAYADLLLRQQRAKQVLQLLKGQDSIEPLLLRIAIAQQQLRDPGLAASRARLQAAFAAETQRGEGIHRREQARFLLDVQQQPQAALQAALDNWKVQHETDDVLVLIRAAQAAGNATQAKPALDFVHLHDLQDVRIEAIATRLAAADKLP
jgi:tetratricopeptide (TPR) repeat protein